MDVLTRLSSVDDADIFSGCMAIDLPGMECFADLPSPGLPEAVRHKELHDRLQQLEGAMQPNTLQSADSNAAAMELQDCLASAAFDAALFGLPDQLNDQFADQFMDTNFPFDMSGEHAVGDMLDENTGTDLSSRVSKESSSEMFHDTPRDTNQANGSAAAAYGLGINSFVTMASSQWPTSYPANFVPAGFIPSGSVPVSCATSSSYAQPSSFMPSSQPQSTMPMKNSFLRGMLSDPANHSLVTSMLEAIDLPDSNDTYTTGGMLDQYSTAWGVHDAASDETFRRQSESGSSGQLSNRAWQPVAQRKAVKRSLGRSKSGSTANDLSPADAPRDGTSMIDASLFPFPKLRPILPRPLDSSYEDNSCEGTPTPTGQTEWLRMQMMKLMTSTPGCAAVPLRNLMNSPRAHSQPSSPSGTRSPRANSRSRPGTPKARTPRGTSTKTVFQTAGPVSSNPSRLGAGTSSPTQRSKVARSANIDVSATLQPQRSDPLRYAFSKPFAPCSAPSPQGGLLAADRGMAAAAGLSGITEQVARLQQALQQAGPSAAQGASAPAAHAPVDTGTATPESGSRPQSGNSNKSTSSAAEMVSLEEALDQLAGSRAALEAGGRLLHLQRSFSRGLSAEAVECVLVALKNAMEVEVVYFPNIPMVLSERQVDLLISALHQKRIWALSLGEGTSLTAEGWELMATHLQSTALAYLYVSPATQASIPQMARVRIRDGLHANRRSAPSRDPVLLAQMQMMSSTPQQPTQSQEPSSQTAVHALTAAPSAPGTVVQSPDAGVATIPAVSEPSPAANTGSPHSSSQSGGSQAAAAPGAAGATASPEAREQLQDSREASGSHSSGTSSSQEVVMEAAGPRSPAASSGPAFADLVAVGLVQPGQYQLSVGAVPSISVAFLPSGGIQWEEVEYTTLSAFAQAVTQRHQLPSTAQDPWKEVCLHGICLEALRQVYIERHQ